MTHLDPTLQAEIASGAGGPEAVAVFQDQFLHARKVGLVSCLQPGTRLTEANQAHLLEGLALLDRADAQITADVVRHPAFGALVAELRRASADEEANSQLKQIHRLGGFAAAAALRSEVFPFAIQAAVEADNSVSIPTLGRLLLGSAVQPETGSSPFVTIVRDEKGVHAKADFGGESRTVPIPADMNTKTDSWQPTPRLEATVNGLTIKLDVNDAPVLAERFARPEKNLPTEEYLQKMQTHLSEAWDLLVNHHPKYARAIAAGMRSIVPLNNADGQGRSATSEAAFGAAAMTQPSSGEMLALSLVHEFQHSMLNGMMGVVPLIVDGNLTRYLYAPWRDDPRHERGLLHGVYAHAAIVDFWRTQLGVHPPDSVKYFVAELEFARWGYGVERALKDLDLLQNLNKAGQVFLEPTRQQIAGWATEREKLSRHARRLAAFYAADHEISWQLANVIPHPDDISAMVDLIESGRTTGKGEIIIRNHIDTSKVGQDFTLTDVRDRRRLAIFSRDYWGKSPSELTKILGREPTANELQMTGNVKSAQELYARRIAADPDDMDAWGSRWVSELIAVPPGWYNSNVEAATAISKEKYRRWIERGNTGTIIVMANQELIDHLLSRSEEVWIQEYPYE